jgi:hypothetical protein
VHWLVCLVHFTQLCSIQNMEPTKYSTNYEMNPASIDLPWKVKATFLSTQEPINSKMTAPLICPLLVLGIIHNASNNYTQLVTETKLEAVITCSEVHYRVHKYTILFTGTLSCSQVHYPVHRYTILGCTWRMDKKSHKTLIQPVPNLRFEARTSSMIHTYILNPWN